MLSVRPHTPTSGVIEDTSTTAVVHRLNIIYMDIHVCTTVQSIIPGAIYYITIIIYCKHITE